MSQGTKICPQCNSEVPSASLRCVECGNRFVSAKTAVQPGLNDSSAELATVDSTSMSIDEMLAMADDIQLNSNKTASPLPVKKTVSAAKAPASSTRPAPAGNLKADTKQPVLKAKAAIPENVTSTKAADKTAGKTVEPAQTSENKPAKSGTSESNLKLIDLTQKKSRGQKRSTSLNTITPDTINHESLQQAIRKALNLSEYEIPVLETSEAASDNSARKKQPSNKQLLKQIEKISQKLESIREDTTKVAFDETRSLLNELCSINIPEAVQVISSFIQDKRPTISETAIKTLGKTRQSSALPLLLKQLLSTDKNKVALTVRSLGALGDRRALEPLLVLTHEFPQFSVRVLDSIEQLGTTAVPGLIELAQHETPGICLNSVMALGKLKDPKAADILEHQLNNDSPVIRSSAAQALGELGLKKSISSLLRKLKDPHPQVRYCLVEALGKLADADAVPGLIRMLKDADQDVVLAAVNSLGECRSIESLDPLHDLLETADLKLIVATIEALGKIGSPDSVPLLIKLLDLPELLQDSQALLTLIEALKKIKSPTATTRMIELLVHENPLVRQRTVEAFGYIADQQSAIALENLYEQETVDEVRIAIIKSLGDIGDHDSFDCVVKALEDVMLVRIKAVIALGQFKDEAGLMYLTPMLNDPSPELRYHAVMSIAEIGKSTIIHQVEPLVLDENTMVQRGAFKALQKLGDTRDEKKILKDVKKRAPKKSKASSISFSFDFSSLLPNSLVGIFVGDNPTLKYGFLGMIGLILLTGIGVGVSSLIPAKEVVIRYGTPYCCDLGPDGLTIALGRSYGVVQILNTEANKVIYSEPVQAGRISGIINLGKNHLLATLDGNVVEINNGKKSFPDGFSTNAKIRLFKTTADASHLYSLDDNMALRVYDTATLKNKGTIALQPGTACVDVSSRGEIVAYGSGISIVVTALDNKPLFEITHPQKPPKVSLKSLVISPDQKQLAASFSDRSLFIWSLENGKLVKSFGPWNIEKSASYDYLCFLGNPNELLAVGTEATHKWNLADGKISASLPGIIYTDISISKDLTKLMFTVDEERSLYFLDLVAFQGVEIKKDISR